MRPCAQRSMRALRFDAPRQTRWLGMFEAAGSGCAGKRPPRIETAGQKTAGQKAAPEDDSPEHRQNTERPELAPHAARRHVRPVASASRQVVTSWVARYLDQRAIAEPARLPCSEHRLPHGALSSPAPSSPPQGATRTRGHLEAYGPRAAARARGLRSTSYCNEQRRAIDNRGGEARQRSLQRAPGVSDREPRLHRRCGATATWRLGTNEAGAARFSPLARRAAQRWRVAPGGRAARSTATM